MKKYLLLLLLLFLFMPSNGQTPIAEKGLIQTNAEKWFKEVYVEEIFKDPYSYKLLKTSVTPISIEESLDARLTELNNELNNDGSGYGYKKVTPETRKQCVEFYNECKSGMEENAILIDKETDETKLKYHKKRFEVHKKSAIESLELIKKIDLHDTNVEEKEYIENIISTASDIEKKKLAYYEIKIDCYSKNSLGNEVLGRFSFPFSLNGPLGDKNGIDKVKHLNKE